MQRIRTKIKKLKEKLTELGRIEPIFCPSCKSEKYNVTFIQELILGASVEIPVYHCVVCGQTWL